MATAGYSRTPLPQKLGIKEDTSVAVLNAPAYFEQALGVLPARATLTAELHPSDVVVLFAITEDELIERFEAAMKLIPADGSIWVSWPKKASDVETELTFDVVHPYGLSTGLVDNKVCAIDETWSSLRFVVRKEFRADWPTRNADVEGAE